MAAIKRSFREGDHIVHHRYGVGVVEAIDKKILNGMKKTYYRIKTSEMTYWVPVSGDIQSDIRKVSSLSTVKSALTLIRKKPEKIADHHRARTDKIKDRAYDLALMTKARIMRDLHGRQMKKSLNFQNQMILDKLKKEFVAEWEIVDEIDPEDAMKKLEEALSISASKK